MCLCGPVEYCKPIIAERRGDVGAERGLFIFDGEEVGATAVTVAGIELLDAAALATMRAIKAALDPRGILNPGKLHPADLL